MRNKDRAGWENFDPYGYKNRGKLWEWRNSLWVLWTFFYPLNFVAFFRIGAKAKRKFWHMVGWLYFALGIPLIILASQLHTAGLVPPWLNSLFSFVVAAAIPGSVIHAFSVRRKYLGLRSHILAREEQRRLHAAMEPRLPLPAQKSAFFGPTDTLPACREALLAYLRENASTPFFREKLGAIAERLGMFTARCGSIQTVLTERFSPTELSFHKFAAPVEGLQEYILRLADSLITRMRLFNEEEYSRRIGEFAAANRAEEAKGYQELQWEYMAYATQTLAALDDAILKLDRFTLELSKLNETDIDKAMDIMHELEMAIADTQFYK